MEEDIFISAHRKAAIAVSVEVGWLDDAGPDECEEEAAHAF